MSHGLSLFTEGAIVRSGCSPLYRVVFNGAALINGDLLVAGRGGRVGIISKASRSRCTENKELFTEDSPLTSRGMSLGSSTSPLLDASASVEFK